MQTPTQSRYADTASLRDTLVALRNFATTASGDFAAAIPLLRADLVAGLTAKGMDETTARSYALEVIGRLNEVKGALDELAASAGAGLGPLTELVIAAGFARAAQLKAEAAA